MDSAYRIAVISPDGIQIRGSFGSAEGFWIYAFSESGSFLQKEYRPVKETVNSERNSTDISEVKEKTACASSCCGGGCTSEGGHDAKTVLLEDCRALLCEKIGFPARKVLDKQNIVVFDLNIEIEEALKKITRYFYRVDHHQSLAGFAGEKD